MQLDEAKNQFIQAWGALGSSWGINRTMSSIHALLIASKDAMTTEEIMDTLKISRGNANMNIRALIEWGLVKREMVAGERKEYFSAGKDVWEIARQIAKERAKRELEPVTKIVADLQTVEDDSEDAKQFVETMAGILDFTTKVNGTLDKFIKSDKNWFYKSLMSLIK
ncbi:GbsR/MarR family transcriptional regulator [Owenweeksia hongkongensis]|uniref:GbsR/MarR family transcriptional regulator n=1 Tax=Owenweeksia hongkongensis TaxID=253245 RepID=UPI003A8E4C04